MFILYCIIEIQYIIIYSIIITVCSIVYILCPMQVYKSFGAHSY